MQKIAIFGFKDSSVGQLINFLPKDQKEKVDCLITIAPQVQIDIEKEHDQRPHRRTSFVKDNKIHGKPVFFTSEFMEVLSERKIDAVYIMEDTGTDREKIYNAVKQNKIDVLTFIHDSVLLAGANIIGEGSIIFPNNYIAYKTDIGRCCYLEPGNNIEHHNVIDDFCNILGNVATGGFTKIGKGTKVNMHVDIIDKLRIGEHSTIGTGSLVMKDVGDNQLWYGRPAKFVRNC